MAIFGIGGLGHLAQQYAQIFGGETIAVDVTEEKLSLAKQLGAAHIVNAATTDPVAAIEALGGADVAVVLAADPRVIEQAHASLRRGGRLILVSLPKDNAMSLPVFQTVLRASGSSGRLSEPVPTWPRCSGCTPPDARGCSMRLASSTTSTSPSRTCWRAGFRPVW